jgi:HK97 gp10 family phage protein
VSNFIPNPVFVEEVRKGPILQAHLEELAQRGADIARRLVPYDPEEPGEHIRDTIDVEDAPNDGKRVVAGTDHWQFVEFGTSRQAAEPFLRPIIDELGLHH